MAEQQITRWLSHAWATDEEIFYRFFSVAERFELPLDFDTLIGVGVSGAVMVPRMANLFGIDFAIVRKEGDGSHAWNKIEGVVGSKWLFVDDLVSSGATVRRVERLMREQFPNSVPVGAYLYHSKECNTAEEMDRETYE